MARGTLVARVRAPVQRAGRLRKGMHAGAARRRASDGGERSGSTYGGHACGFPANERRTRLAPAVRRSSEGREKTHLRFPLRSQLVSPPDGPRRRWPRVDSWAVRSTHESLALARPAAIGICAEAERREAERAPAKTRPRLRREKMPTKSQPEARRNGSRFRLGLGVLLAAALRVSPCPPPLAAEYTAGPRPPWLANLRPAKLCVSCTSARPDPRSLPCTLRRSKSPQFAAPGRRLTAATASAVHRRMQKLLADRAQCNQAAF